MVFEKNGGLLESLVAGSRYDALPRYRVTFNMLSVSNGIRVLGNQALVANPGSGFERQMTLDAKKHRRGMQALLDGVAVVAGHGITTYAAPPHVANEPSTAPTHPQPPIEPPQLSERQRLERDLADVRRLKGLAAPGGRDEEYYARREAELESQIAGIQLKEAAPKGR